MIEFFEDLLFLIVVKIWVVSIFIDPLLNPIDTLGVTYVHILHADRLAVDAFEVNDNIRQGSCPDPDDIPCAKYGC